jgi:hypothetical protein
MYLRDPKLAVWAVPHQVSGLGGYDHLVTVRSQVGVEDLAEVPLS